MSKIEVNQISSQCGSTLTVGQSGDTVTLASGASQTGFGRTGTVDWDTTPKTATFSAVSGNGYFCNTSGGAFTVNLPAGSAGAIVSVQDYNNTFDTNNLTIDPNGSEKINGGDAGIALTLSTEGQGLTLVYIDATVGWRSVHSDDFSQVPQAPAFITATGGTITCCGDYKIHTFTSPGTFTVSCAGNPGGSSQVSYMVVAGGGSGGHGNNGGGGGGAGGFREGKASSDCYTASPLNAPAGLPVTAQAYPITVGSGAASVSNPDNGNIGSNSVFSTITSAGGGGGDRWNDGLQSAGGSGGGSAQPNGTGAAGNTPPVSPPQGNAGGNLGYWQMGGGGGATVAGTPGHADSGTCGGSSSNRNGKGGGGNGATTSISATSTSYAGGGGGGFSDAGSLSPSSDYAPGGTGGGANGGPDGQNGTANTGGGGGGSPQPNPGNSGSGGSGIVIIRYKFQ